MTMTLEPPAPPRRPRPSPKGMNVAERVARGCPACGNRFVSYREIPSEICEDCLTAGTIWQSVIGIDQSLAKTGVTVLMYRKDPENPNALLVRTAYSGLIPTSKRDDVSHLERALQIGARLAELIRVYAPVEIAVEEYAFNAKMPRYAAALGEVGAVIKLTCAHHLGMIPAVINISTLKKLVTGDGRASKEKVIAGVNARWGTRHTDDNIADSCALAWTALALTEWGPLADGFYDGDDELATLSKLRLARRGERRHWLGKVVA